MQRSKAEVLHVREGQITMQLWPTESGAILGTIRQQVSVGDQTRVEEIPVVVPASQVGDELRTLAARERKSTYLVAAWLGMPAEVGEPQPVEGTNRVLPLGQLPYKGEMRPVRAFLNSFLPYGDRVYCTTGRADNGSSAVA